MIDPLPSFKHPPVVETVLGVQFDPMKGFTNAHLGAFWKALGGEWPVVADAPSLPPQYERFGDERAWDSLGLQLKLTSDPSSRLQIRNRADDRMIQVQNGRLHLNWLGQTGSEYPRYRKVRAEFANLFERFCQFLTNAQLGEPKLNQWEITYVNHIPHGLPWGALSDLPKVLHFFGNAPSLPGTSGLEGFAGAWHFELPPKRGRLHVEVRHGRRTVPDDQEIVVLTLTARGPLGDGFDGYDVGLSMGREAIVRGFAAMTTEFVQRFWEPEDERSTRQ